MLDTHFLFFIITFFIFLPTNFLASFKGWKWCYISVRSSSIIQYFFFSFLYLLAITAKKFNLFDIFIKKNISFTLLIFFISVILDILILNNYSPLFIRKLYSIYSLYSFNLCSCNPNGIKENNYSSIFQKNINTINFCSYNKKIYYFIYKLIISYYIYFLFFSS